MLETPVDSGTKPLCQPLLKNLHHLVSSYN